MMTTNDIIKEIVNSNRNIEAMTIIRFPNTSALQDRFQKIDPIRNAIDKALNIRSVYSLPFWDALLCSQFDYSVYSPEILREALFHNKNIHQIDLNRKDLQSLDEFTFSRQSNFGINSRVITTDQGVSHFVFLDFHIPNKAENIPCVEEVLKLLNLSGYLLETNKSYHFIGAKLVDENELKKMLYHALLFCPIIDKNWIAHQLIEGSCTLRLTPKENQIPCLLKYVG